MTVADLLRRVSSSELSEWISLYELRAEEAEAEAARMRRQTPVAGRDAVAEPDEVARIIQEAQERERARGDGS